MIEVTTTFVIENFSKLVDEVISSDLLFAEEAKMRLRTKRNQCQVVAFDLIPAYYLKATSVDTSSSSDSSEEEEEEKSGESTSTTSSVVSIGSEPPARLVKALWYSIALVDTNNRTTAAHTQDMGKCEFGRDGQPRRPPMRVDLATILDRKQKLIDEEDVLHVRCFATKVEFYPKQA